MQELKLPKEIDDIISAIENSGFEAYAVGGAVRDLLLGYEPLDWDIATSASLKELLRVFPDVKVVNEEFEVVRLEAANVDIARFRVDGNYSDHKRPDDVIFIDDIKEDLKRRDFTVNAIAYNSQKGFVDPFDGRHDITNKLIRMIGDPFVRLVDDPIRMVRAIRITAETGFDLHMQIYKAIYGKSALFENASIDKIRMEFEKLVVGNFAGKGFKMLVATGIFRYILGSFSKTQKELRQFEILAERLGKAENKKNIRLGLFYTCFDKKNAILAIERMNFDSKTIAILDDAINELESVTLCTDKLELKQLIARIGMERYKYLDELSRGKQVVYNLHDRKILERQAMLEEIEANDEPIFLQDLKIDGNDITEGGIAKGEKVGELLQMLLALVHREPERNTKNELLAYTENMRTTG
jgi:tRNA nucleotidyltransferase (CCA-adding enzyme)